VLEKRLALPKEERQSQVSFSTSALANGRQYLIPTNRGQWGSLSHIFPPKAIATAGQPRHKNR